jgi:CheY-like chemotaxis protein
MPVMDGLEATRNIRSLPVIRERRLPIIALTANVLQDDIDNCYLAGMDDHIGEPLEISDVLEKLNEYLI